MRQQVVQLCGRTIPSSTNTGWWLRRRASLLLHAAGVRSTAHSRRPSGRRRTAVDTLTVLLCLVAVSVLHVLFTMTVNMCMVHTQCDPTPRALEAIQTSSVLGVRGTRHGRTGRFASHQQELAADQGQLATVRRSACVLVRRYQAGWPGLQAIHARRPEEEFMWSPQG